MSITIYNKGKNPIRYASEDKDKKCETLLPGGQANVSDEIAEKLKGLYPKVIINLVADKSDEDVSLLKKEIKKQAKKIAEQKAVIEDLSDQIKKLVEVDKMEGDEVKESEAEKEDIEVAEEKKEAKSKKKANK